MRKPPASMMGIECPTGSHVPVLEACLATMPPDGLVLEHGAGLYSTPLLARVGVRVVCSEPNLGWLEWARWIYQGRAEIVESVKPAVARIREFSLVFVDGPAKERGFLMQAALDAEVPAIIAHDTQDGEWGHYGYQPHMFKHPRYAVTQHAEGSHRTTLWRLL